MYSSYVAKGDVRLKESSFGDVPHQLVAAVERHSGERRLHFKATFKQPAMPALMKLAQAGVSGEFEVTLVIIGPLTVV